jgi:DNA polymerase I-like protein with 3'-5' exonuclease and polymerase domains
MITYAADFESYYDDECSVRILGNRGYFSHPNFDAYLLSVVGDDGYTFCGNPRDFDWSLFDGNAVLSHNAAFDQTLYLFGVEQGWWPACAPAEWHCTADMCAYFSLPRALKNAAHWVFGIEMEKTVRDNMKGKRWETMTGEFKKEVTDYAIKDSEICLKLWQELGPKWPEQERAVSHHTRDMMRRGLPVDEPALEQAVQILKQKLFDAESLIPWAGEKKLLSPIAFAEECRKFGIEPPKSMAMDNEECDEWMERFGEQLPFAAAIRNWRRINSLAKKLTAMRAAVDNGRYYGGLLYCGAHTRRFSGSGGNLNLQNLPKEEMFGVNVRPLIKASPGKKLVVVDLSQIEVRTAVWLSGDMKTMELIRSTPDLYEAFGIAFGLWKAEDGSLREKNPKLRQMLKIIGLGVLYGASAPKVATIAGCSEQEASQMVRIVHRTLKPVTQLWKKLTTLLNTARKDGSLTLTLPSGNRLYYRNVKSGGGRATVGDIVKNGRPMTVRLWFGSLVENCLTGDTLIEVLRGPIPEWIRLDALEEDDLVCDGVSFVSHRGLKHSGVQSVIECHGVSCTPEHQFLDKNNSWVEAEKACKQPRSMVDYAHGLTKAGEGLHRAEVRQHGCYPPDRETQTTTGVGNAVRLWEHIYPLFRGYSFRTLLRGGLPNTQKERQRVPENSRNVQAQALCSVAVDVRPLSAADPSGVEELRGPWYSGLRALATKLRELLLRHGPFVGRGTVLGQKRQQRGLLSRELPVDHVSGKRPKHESLSDTGVGPRRGGTERGEILDPLVSLERGDAPDRSLQNPGQLSKPVYDILDCGPRNQFLVKGVDGQQLIAHNCSQSLARDIFVDRLLEIEKLGYQVILHVHDEVVIEIDGDKADKCLTEVIDLMSTPPAWIPSIALSAEGKVLSHYAK